MITSMDIHEFIKERKYLIWYVNDYDKLDNRAIVEATLNYGDWDDVQKLIEILGIKKMANIFKQQIEKYRCNYDLATINYFKLYFAKYAAVVFGKTNEKCDKCGRMISH